MKIVVICVKWLVMHDSLPTNLLRHKRGLADSAVCMRCGKEEERILHCLQDCTKARAVWSRVGIGSDMRMDSQDHKAWVKLIANAPNNVTLCATLWWVWRARNSELIANKILSVDMIVRAILGKVEAFRTNFFHDEMVPKSPRWVRWEWPPEGVMKLNVDGCSRGNPGLAGFGGLVRDDGGQWILGFAGRVGVADNLLPELMAICVGLKLAWEHGLRLFIVKLTPLRL